MRKQPVVLLTALPVTGSPPQSSAAVNRDIDCEADVDPLPETADALRELTRLGDESIAHTLWRICRDAERVVPELVGVSVSVNGSLTFTMTATNRPVAELDGVQYLAGGPCEDTLHTGQRHTYSQGDRGDEDRWQLFARATAAAGVGSTLSLPIVTDGTVVAGINLYASTTDAFDGHHDELAAACGALVDGAITNADMSFTTRFWAAETPSRLRIGNLMDQATGALMSRWSISAEDATERLRTSAQRAGISDAQMARAVIGLLTQATNERPADDLD